MMMMGMCVHGWMGFMYVVSKSWLFVSCVVEVNQIRRDGDDELEKKVVKNMIRQRGFVCGEKLNRFVIMRHA